jgi:hypothetical protein
MQHVATQNVIGMLTQNCVVTDESHAYETFIYTRRRIICFDNSNWL